MQCNACTALQCRCLQLSVKDLNLCYAICKIYQKTSTVQCAAIKSQNLHPQHCTEALPPRCLMSGERAPGENLMFLMAPLWNPGGGRISIKENILSNNFYRWKIEIDPFDTDRERRRMERGKLTLAPNSDQVSTKGKLTNFSRFQANWVPDSQLFPNPRRLNIEQKVKKEKFSPKWRAWITNQ